MVITRSGLASQKRINVCISPHQMRCFCVCGLGRALTETETTPQEPLSEIATGSTIKLAPLGLYGDDRVVASRKKKAAETSGIIQGDSGTVSEDAEGYGEPDLTLLDLSFRELCKQYPGIYWEDVVGVIDGTYPKMEEWIAARKWKVRSSSFTAVLCR